MNEENQKKSRADASRENGAKSHGPTSPTGKEISSRNARKHGLCMNPGNFEGEVLDDFNQLLDALTAEFQPLGTVELKYVRDMATAEFRLELINHRQEELLIRSIKENKDELSLLLRYETASRRQYERSLADLKKARKEMQQENDREMKRDQQQQQQQSSILPPGFLESYMNAKIPDDVYKHLMSFPPTAPDPDALRNEPEKTPDRR